jgi:pantoate kinase
MMTAGSIGTSVTISKTIKVKVKVLPITGHEGPEGE